MAENVLAMTLKMRNRAATTAENLRQSVEKVGTTSMKAGTRFGKSVKAMRTSTTGLMSQMISLKTLIIAAFAYKSIVRFGRFLSSLTKLFREQEVASRKLYQTMASMGNYREEEATMLSEYANKLQYVVGIANETIETNMGMLAAYGMTAKEIKQAILPAIDLSIARNIDLRASVDLLGKAYVGYTGTLSRYGIILDEGLSKEEKYSEALKKVSELTGVAAGVTETYAGKVTVMNEAYRDFKKQMGGIIAAGLEQSGVLDSMTYKFSAWDIALKNLRPVLAWTASVGIVNVTEAMLGLKAALTGDTGLAVMITIIDTVRIAFNAMQIWFRRMIDGFQYMSKAIEYLIISLIQLKAFFFDTVEEFQVLQRAREQSVEEFWQLVESESERSAEAANKDMEAIKKAWEQATSAWALADEGKLAETVKAQMEAINAELEKQNFLGQANIRNLTRANQERAKAFQLTQGMARQFALATRLEQEQVKYLMQKLPQMTAQNIGLLTEMERKLISRQPVLKESFTELFGKYAQEMLGIETDFLGKIETTVKIDLTEEAKTILSVSQIETKRSNDRNMERLAG